MVFKYQAQDKQGKIINAQATAPSASSLVLTLKNQGLLPLNIKELKAKTQAQKFSLKKKTLASRSVKLKELAVFSRQLSSSLAAGIPLIEALTTICEDLENQYFRAILEDIIESINSGSNFSEALSKHKGVFSPTFIALISAGETSGSLDKTTANLAKYLENLDRIIRKVKSAIRYPIFIVSFMVLVVGIMVVFIIPKFEALFSQAKVRLPLLTRMVVGFSNLVIHHFLWMVLTVLAICVLYIFLLRFQKVRLFVDRHKLDLPLFGKIIRKALILRFARTLSILISGGVGLVNCLPICANVVNNLYLKGIIEQIKNNVVAGATLSNELKNQAVFPRMFIKMVQVGEKTGKISEMLSRNADYYEEELDATLNDLTALIEPMLIVIIGAVVLVVVLALYLPIFSMSSAIK